MDGDQVLTEGLRSESVGMLPVRSKPVYKVRKQILVKPAHIDLDKLPDSHSFL